MKDNLKETIIEHKFNQKEQHLINLKKGMGKLWKNKNLQIILMKMQEI